MISDKLSVPVKPEALDLIYLRYGTNICSKNPEDKVAIVSIYYSGYKYLDSDNILVSVAKLVLNFTRLRD